MKWGLTQGLIGRKHTSLSPSVRAVGPNTYLSEQDFLKMLGIAAAAHAIIFILASLFPHEKVTNIPVRALSFKLGDTDVTAAYGSAAGVGITMNQPAAPAAPTMGSDESWRATAAAPAPVTPAPLQPIRPARSTAAYVPRPVKAQKLVPIEQPEQRQVPVENVPAPVVTQPMPQPVVAAPVPIAAPVPEPVPAPQSQLPSTAVLTQPAIAPNPQQYVREVGTPSGTIGGQGNESTMTAKTMQEIRERYEMQISGWIERHKFYPPEAGGREGRTVVRMRIDRTGYVRYYAIEESSGVPMIDAAAIDMIRRANPVPAVPDNYPAGTLIEFLIPITFRAPK